MRGFTLKVTKAFLLITFLFVIVSSTALAQDMTEIHTTDFGVSFNYPDNFALVNVDGLSTTFAQADDNRFELRIELYENYISGMDVASPTVQDIYIELIEQVENALGTQMDGVPTELTINESNAIWQNIADSGMGVGTLFVFGINDHSFGMAISYGVDVDVLTAVAESIQVDNAIYAAAFDLPQSEGDIPAGRFTLDQMPEGMIWLYNEINGSQFTYPADRWTPVQIGPFVDNMVGLQSGDPRTIIANVTDEGPDSEEAVLDHYADWLLPNVAEAYDLPEFDPETSLMEVELGDGRTALVYDTMFITSTEVSGELQGEIYYFIPLAEAHFGVIAVAFSGKVELEDLRLDLYDMASSFVLRETLADDEVIAIDPAETATLPEVVAIDCSTQSREIIGENEMSMVVACPAGCTAITLWGTDIYTDDSAICSAAAHAGLTTLKSGGTVRIDSAPGENAYDGTVRNGIESIDYGPWGGSFTLTAVETAE